MTVIIDESAYAQIQFGIHRAKSAISIAGANTKALFTVTGGRVAMMAIVGEVTTIISAGANATKLISTPTTGTAVDLCAALDIVNDEVGCLYGITGLATDAMVGANAGAAPLPRNPVVVPIGTIGMNQAGNTTGAIKWDLWYIPLDDDATVAAA